ncbi:TetR/AcrR family transcriptional regulator [Streptosporangium sp. OZ121]|uniref:TetR/AcrR family transcriptional regulator n=1 Tax=Streptosporangium sp. OZ121 TaxID=3444183 RepID=UPI003F7A9B59
MPDSRSLLLTAAAEEFAVRGREGTRVQSIVRRAGVNERMIYYHFGSKDALYAAVLEAEMAEMADAWRPIIDRAAEREPYQGMREVLAGFVDVITARPRLTALLVHEALAGWPATTPPVADMLPAALRELYRQGQEQGAFRADCSFEVAYGTALCALIALPIFLPRFAGVFGTEADGHAVGHDLRDRIVGQLLDGMTGPRAG